MTKQEFAEVIAFLELATGKPIHDDPKEALARTRLYFQMLGDLPLEALRASAERLVCERKWSSFPQVAELRELAAGIANNGDEMPSAGAAWQMAIKTSLKMVAERLDFVNSVPREQWNKGCLDQLPAVVGEALRQFGFERIQDMPNDQMGTAFAQFRSVYESCVGKEQERRLLPAALQNRIEKIGAGELPAAVKDKLLQIGQPDVSKLSTQGESL